TRNSWLVRSPNALVVKDQRLHDKFQVGRVLGAVSYCGKRGLSMKLMFLAFVAAFSIQLSAQDSLNRSAGIQAPVGTSPCAANALKLRRLRCLPRRVPAALAAGGR